MRTEWGVPNTEPNKNPSVLPKDREAFEQLITANVPRYNQLLFEGNLWLAGLIPGDGMAPSLQAIRKAATKRRKVREDGAPAEKRATKIVKRTEAREASGRNEAERAEAGEASERNEVERAEAGEALGRNKVERAEAGEASGGNEAEERDRPRSPLPAPPSSPIDLTGSSLGQETEVPPSPPAMPEAELIVSAVKPILEVAPSNGGAGAESLQAEAPVEAPAASAPAPMATEATEDEADAPSFQSILLHHSRWAEKMMSQASVPEI